jgi:hypothetical protein
MRSRKEVFSFDVSTMTKDEQEEMFASMPIKSLKTWLEYYEKREQYEVCAVIQKIIDEKNR